MQTYFFICKPLENFHLYCNQTDDRKQQYIRKTLKLVH